MSYAMTNCPNCGAVIDPWKQKCDYCGTAFASDKINFIIQVANDARREKLENHLRDSRYGIAYIDGTEKIIQLNRVHVNEQD